MHRTPTRCSARRVYGITDPAAEGLFGGWSQFIYLEPGVAANVPEIAAARAWLLEQGAIGARMTGSGSVVFGVARDQAHAREIVAAPGAPGRPWVARCLTREEAALTVQPFG